MYTIRRFKGDCPPWERAERLSINWFGWGGDYRPETEAALLYQEERGFWLRFRCREERPRTRIAEHNGTVCLSPTFVLVTCGAASMSLATLMYYIDIRNKQRWCRFFIIFGVNPLFLYVLSEVLAIMMGSTGWKAAAYAAIHSGITDAYLASAVYALVFTLFLGCIGYPLYLKKIYIKL